MNILGIAGWLPSSLSVAMTPLFNDYVRDRFGYEVEFAFAEAPFADLFQRAATSLATRSQEFNIIISDSQWIGALAEPGWILQLNDVIAANPGLDIDWYSQTVVDTYMDRRSAGTVSRSNLWRASNSMATGSSSTSILSPLPVNRCLDYRS